MPVRLQLFGAPAVTLDDGAPALALPFERRSQLLVLLALRRAWVARAEVATLLWPEQPEKLASANLRKTLFRLPGMDWGGLVESDGGSLRAVAEADVHDFEQALRKRRLADALALYAGPLLAGFDDDDNEAWSDWLQFERQRLQAAWRAAALEHLAGEGVDAGEGAALAARLLEHDPLDEAALRLHMSLLARHGQAARAHEAYRRFAERLRDELGLAPASELQALHDAIGSAALARAAAPAPPAPADPAEAGFVGRAGERRRIAELLARDEVRLLNLVGPGGIGKTRLAQRALHDLAGAFADGAHFVRLEDVSDAGELVARIARETGTALRGRAPALEQLAAALRERQLLLVLDNLEQLADVAPAVIDPLLAACPRLKLIATSRVRLGLASEQLLPLEGLPCPEREDADRVEAFDAARLFVAAARRVEPGLLPAVEAAAIVEICRLVDGLPLALELAAAWTRVLSCEAIADELREGTALLRASDASHPARHASIEHVFEQSWRRLGDAEREALAGLTVFQGGFSLEAARAVAGTPLPVLGALVDKSLLRKDGTRLSQHPLVQQLAAARLAPAARQAARRAHMDYFRRGLGPLRVALGHGERAALDAVEAEIENHLHAWRWAIDTGHAQAVREIGGALQRYFDHRGPFEEGLALVRQALDAPTLRDDAGLQCWLAGEAAQFEYRLDRYAQAEALAAHALAGARSSRQREAAREK
ncbi:ATP-binding protein [Caldimonas sp. KR1-144]|uniref:ATP-binding protein n=1 Tax=Caldimonas sp. KR1-144 TaxID=3400911 RepID=UPI003BFD1FCF